jgi:hypothetical protein
VKARRVIAGVAPLAVAVAVAGTAGASAASSRSVDGRAAAAAPSVRPVDGRTAAAARSVQPVDGRVAAAAPSVQPVDGRAAAATPSVQPVDGRVAAATGSVQPEDGRVAAAAPSVRLTVDFTRRGGSGHQVAHVRCAAAGNRVDGFLRAVGARRACATARRIAAFLASRPDPNRACSQIFGGPERALVAGTIGARRIRRAFSRTDGCKVADWRRAMPLLPRPS